MEKILKEKDKHGLLLRFHTYSHTHTLSNNYKIPFSLRVFFLISKNNEAQKISSIRFVHFLCSQSFFQVLHCWSIFEWIEFKLIYLVKRCCKFCVVFFVSIEVILFWLILLAIPFLLLFIFAVVIINP